MAIERLVGLYVKDDELYQKYREAMSPILETFGGGFGYDFKIAEVLKSEVDAPINRVFTIFFENEDAMNSFFSNEKYLEVKKQYFEVSVSSVTEIARYEKFV
ncbi:MAG: hypothetical protein ACI86H_001827 [bacterium]|jgi:uncharacterized protein (DUF1330 family)